MADILFAVDSTRFSSQFTELPTQISDAATAYESWRVEAGLPTGTISSIDGDDSIWLIDLGFSIGESSQSLVTFTTEGAMHFYKSSTPTANRSNSYNIPANPELNQPGMQRLYFSANLTPSISLAWGIDGDMTSDSGKWQTNGVDTAILFVGTQTRFSPNDFRVEIAFKFTPTNIEVIATYVSGVKTGQFSVYTFTEQGTVSNATLIPTDTDGGQSFEVSAGTLSFSTLTETIMGFVKNGITGEPIENALVRSYSPSTGILFNSTTTDAVGSYEVNIPVDFQTYLVALATGFPSKVKDFTEEQTDPYTFQMGVDGGGVDPDPTFKAMIRGNVQKLGVPFGAEIVGVSNAEPPAVVGTTTSDATTGDYELDVAPYTGQVNVMAIPDYGVEFTTNAVYPLGAIVRPTTPNGYLYEVTEAGTTDVNNEPTWPTQENQVVVSGTVTFVTRYMLRPLVNSLLTPVIEPLDGNV